MSKKIYINVGVLAIVLGLIFFINISFVNLLLAFIVIVAFVFSNLNHDFKDLFYNNKSHLRLLGKSFLYASFIVAVSHFVLAPIIFWLTKTPVNLGFFDAVRGNLKFLTISLLLGWFVGGLLEETIFRAFFIRVSEKLLPKPVGLIIGILLSSFIFGFLHSYQGISGQLLTGSVGCILAIIYVLNEKNLWLNIYVHGMMNTISLLIVYFDLV